MLLHAARRDRMLRSSFGSSCSGPLVLTHPTQLLNARATSDSGRATAHRVQGEPRRNRRRRHAKARDAQGLHEPVDVVAVVVGVERIILVARFTAADLIWDSEAESIRGQPRIRVRRVADRYILGRCLMDFCSAAGNAARTRSTSASPDAARNFSLMRSTRATRASRIRPRDPQMYRHRRELEAARVIGQAKRLILGRSCQTGAGYPPRRWNRQRELRVPERAPSTPP